MSINPVATVPAEAEAPEFKPRSAPIQAWIAPGGNAAIAPSAGSAPKQQTHAAQPAAPSAELPQDEVQVQRDSQADGEIVVKYIDHYGNVIVQVPSTELLGLARAISQDFQHQLKVRSAGVTAAGDEGVSKNGH